MTIFSKNFGGHGPFGPPGYAYAGAVFGAGRTRVEKFFVRVTEC